MESFSERLDNIKVDISIIENANKCLQNEIEKLESALGFYADSTNYGARLYGEGNTSDIDIDGGEIARKTLNIQ